MINKLTTSTTSLTSSTTPAWGVVDTLSPAEKPQKSDQATAPSREAVEETPVVNQTPKATQALNPLGNFASNSVPNVGSNSGYPISFAPRIPLTAQQQQALDMIRKNSFLPVQPSINGVVLPTTATALPTQLTSPTPSSLFNTNPNNSLGSNSIAPLFEKLLSSLG